MTLRVKGTVSDNGRLATCDTRQCFFVFLFYLEACTFPFLSPYDSPVSPADPFSSSSTVTSAPVTGAPTFSKPRSMALEPSSSELEPAPRAADCGSLPMAEPWACEVPNPMRAFSNSRSTREMLTFPKWSPLSICKTGTLVKGEIYMPLWPCKS